MAWVSLMISGKASLTMQRLELSSSPCLNLMRERDKKISVKSGLDLILFHRKEKGGKGCEDEGG